MKLKSLTLALLFAAWSVASASAAVTSMQNGKWTVDYDDERHTVTLIKDGQTTLSGVSVKFKYNGAMHDTSKFSDAKCSEVTFTDALGTGRKVTIRHTKEGMPAVDQTFLLFPGKDFVVSEATLSSPAVISSNFIIPVCTYDNNKFLPSDQQNRLITVPFDNDGFVTYGSYPISRSNDETGRGPGRYARDTISFEATSIFNGETQVGLVLGSIDHNNWKNAIRMTGSPTTQGIMKRIECISGITHGATHDNREHGYLSGKEVKSSRWFVGYYDDWRDGMEEFADVNVAYTPHRRWNGPTPFGWNSWGGMGTNVNFEGVMSVSDLLAKNFQGKGGFAPDNVCFVGLDSYWGNLDWDQLKEFADRCYANGQIPGIYTTPFTNWVHTDSDAVEGNNGYYYGDILLRVNGQKTSSMDPTHPGTLSLMNYQIDRFKEMGFRYIKLDFLTSGSIEADYYYNKDITTGIQAYNYGMKHFADRCGDDFFIVYSIAPTFPANFANARRISCDAWGEMWHTSYMMNCQSFGWWLGRIYQYNDPDHLVVGYQNDGWNRARVTSAAVTGYCMLGDNLSTEGSYKGDPAQIQRAIKWFTQFPEVLEIIHLGVSFRPAYGHKVTGVNNSIDLFTHETDDCYYIAYFNYGIGDTSGELDLAKLGVDVSKVDIAASKELWSKSAAKIADGKLSYTLKHDDANIYKLPKKK